MSRLSGWDPDTGEICQCKLSRKYIQCQELKEIATEEMEEKLKEYGYRMKFPAKTGDLSPSLVQCIPENYGCRLRYEQPEPAGGT